MGRGESAEPAPRVEGYLGGFGPVPFHQQKVPYQDASNAQLVQESLTKYCDASGQKVNLAKSSIFFNRGCKQTLRDNIKTITQVENESLNEKYLGLPTEVGRSTNNAFKYLKDKVWNKIQGWIEQTSSAGGKEVLIKICCTSYPYLYHGLFQIAERAL